MGAEIAVRYRFELEGLTRVEQIRFLESLSDGASELAAERIAAELDEGKSARKLAAEIGKSKTHVAYAAKAWQLKVAGDGRPFNEVYNSPEVRGTRKVVKVTPEPAPAVIPSVLEPAAQEPPGASEAVSPPAPADGEPAAGEAQPEGQEQAAGPSPAQPVAQERQHRHRYTLACQVCHAPHLNADVVSIPDMCDLVERLREECAQLREERDQLAAWGPARWWPQEQAGKCSHRKWLPACPDCGEPRPMVARLWEVTAERDQLQARVAELEAGVAGPREQAGEAAREPVEENGSPDFSDLSWATGP